LQATRTERPPDEHRRAFTSPADFSLWATPVGRKVVKGSGGCQMRLRWCSEQRIRDPLRGANRRVYLGLERALPFCLPQRAPPRTSTASLSQLHLISQDRLSMRGAR